MNNLTPEQNEEVGYELKQAARSGFCKGNFVDRVK